MTTTTGHGTGATTFTRFLDLPKELRLIIWESTCPADRVIQIISTRKIPSLWLLDEAGINWTISGTTPVALLVCQESRDLAKEKYRPLFECLGTQDRCPDVKAVNFVGLRNIRIDLDRDTILIGPAKMNYVLHYLDFSKIQHLAVAFYEEYLNTNPMMTGRLGGIPVWIGARGWTTIWPNLKSLTFVLGRTSLVPAQSNRHWQPYFRLVDVDSNFVDMVQWLQQRLPPEIKTRATPFATLSNLGSIATSLRANFHENRELIEQQNRWQNLAFRASVAVFPETTFRQNGSEDWVTSYLTMSEDKNDIPKGWARDFYANIGRGPFLWSVYTTICRRDSELKSRYDGIKELFLE
jgi:hypothetical protein